MKMNNKILAIIVVIIVVLFVMNLYKPKEYQKMAITNIINRNVNITNPYCTETVKVTHTVALTDTDGTANEWFHIDENASSWTYNKGDFNYNAGLNLLQKAQLDLAAGTYTYYYTVTTPSTPGTLTFSGTYEVGEGVNTGGIKSVGGTPSITCTACSVTSCTSGNKYCCDGLDSNCNHLIDETNELSFNSPCAKQNGVCSGSKASICSGGNWAACTSTNYGINYEATETKCDNLDNDCDNSIDETLTRVCSITNTFGTCNGIETCSVGTYAGCTSKTPADEKVMGCNSIDDDCDGSTDESKKTVADVDCDTFVEPTEIGPAISAYYGSTAVFPAGTITPSNIGSIIQAYYGA